MLLTFSTKEYGDRAMSKNLLMMLACALALFAMFFIFPQCASTPAASPAAVETVAPYAGPSVPAGYLTPGDLLGTEWQVVNLQQDPVFGLYWFFLKCTKVRDGRTHALVVIAPGQDWPALYNYLENGELVFLKLSKSGAYVIDKVEVDVYNKVTEYYQMYLGVTVQKRKGV
jgi:hypothetical protein